MDAPSWGWDKWMYLAAPLGIYAVCILALFALGRTEETHPIKFFFRQISDSLRRLTGFPGWAMAGVLSGLMSLLIAVIGFYWDVAWHLDFGRDEQLFTPSHVMILVGLGGLIYSAVVATIFASVDRENVGFGLGPLRVPWSALSLAVMGVGSVASFPLDALWHQAYGLDVTLWSPTHLQLLGGGALATLTLLLMIAEGRRGATPTPAGRAVLVMSAGAALAGMSTFQGEFDFGMPQFQLLYLPVLIAAAAGLALVFTRLALGPWGAVKAVLFYLVLRVALVAMVTGGLGHTVPRFPLYLASALLVEAAAALIGTRNRLNFALGAGAAVGTVGLAAELVWVTAFYGGPASPVLLPKIAVLGPLAAISGALLGAGLGGAFSSSRTSPKVGVPALAVAGLVLLGALAYPVPRREGNVTGTIKLHGTGERAKVEVILDDVDAARNATVFGVGSWQGGGTLRTPLEEIEPGRYMSADAMPITGRWKTMVGLERGSEVMAAPVYMPADPEISAVAVPALPERQVRFVKNTKLLLREAHEGPGWPAGVVWAGWIIFVALWVASLATIVVKVRGVSEPEEGTAAPDDSVAGVARSAWEDARWTTPARTNGLEDLPVEGYDRVGPKAFRSNQN